MIFAAKGKTDARGLALIAAVAFLSACAPPPDSLEGSRLTQAPQGTPVPPPQEAGDIAIAGQYAAHAMMDLPEVANATTPPMVQFTGVTSIVTGAVPVDTEPYTELLRDRLVLITREKLRFVERTLPPLVITSKHGKKAKSDTATQGTENADYEVLAELHGRDKDPTYRVQIQFVDLHTGAVLYNGLYRISKEGPPDAGDGYAPEESSGSSTPPAPESAAPQNGPVVSPPPPPDTGTVPPSSSPAQPPPASGMNQ